MNTYSFCVITDGREPDKTLRLIKSIRDQEAPSYEILIAGAVPPLLSRVADITIQMPEEARQGRLGAMRNALCREAHGNILIVLDDDILLSDDWLTGMLEYKGDWDILSCVILNPDGTRFWDWKRAWNGVNELLPYDATHPDVSLTGGLCIMKDYVFAAVQWDDKKGFYQEEDVDWSNRAKAAGFTIKFNPYATTMHDGPYTGDGRVVYRRGR